MIQFSMSSVIILGDHGRYGTYVLRIRVGTALNMQVGRFNGGALVGIPAGEYLYVGSAAGRGSGLRALARRLLRHATRSGSRSPHSIRADLAAAFEHFGLPGSVLQPPQQKKLHWHIDYLLDAAAASLEQVYAITAAQRLEVPFACQLAGDPHTTILVPGLGASDNPGSTHFLHITAGESWWMALPGRMLALRSG